MGSRWLPGLPIQVQEHQRPRGRTGNWPPSSNPGNPGSKARPQWAPTLLVELRLDLAHAWGIVLEQLGHGLLEVAVVLFGILLDIERLGRGAAPHELFGSRVE